MPLIYGILKYTDVYTHALHIEVKHFDNLKDCIPQKTKKKNPEMHQIILSN